MVMGEITTKAKIDIEKIARDVVCEIGYDSPEKALTDIPARFKSLLTSSPRT